MPFRLHPLFHSAAPTLSFGRTHSSIRPHPLCHPDRSGGISSSWHKTLLIHSGMQVWVLVCRRSFGCAQDDRLGCHSAAPTLPFGRTHSFIRLHPLFHSAAPTLPFGCTHSSIRLHPLCHPDRSGGISSSWHKTLLIHSDMQVWVLVCRRSFGCAQDDRLGCHSGRPYPFIRPHLNFQPIHKYINLVLSNGYCLKKLIII